MWVELGDPTAGCSLKSVSKINKTNLFKTNPNKQLSHTADVAMLICNGPSCIVLLELLHYWSFAWPDVF